MHVEIMKAFACKPLKLSSNKVLVLGSIKGAKEPKYFWQHIRKNTGVRIVKESGLPKRLFLVHRPH